MYRNTTCSAVTVRPAIELSKIYVLPDQHGAGAAVALMSAALQKADELGFRAVWLGVNQQNQRAQRLPQARLRRQRHQDISSSAPVSNTTT